LGAFPIQFYPNFETIRVCAISAAALHSKKKFKFGADSVDECGEYGYRASMNLAYGSTQQG
jgi:hypothetical protein